MRMLLLTSMCWLLAVGTAVRADTILGNFDPTEEAGWGYWSGGLQTPISGGDEMEVSTEAATTGTSSVKMGHDGWQQALAYSAGTAGTIADFAANDTIEFDVIFKTDTAPNGGYQKIESVTFNYDAGWTTLSGSELFHGWGASTDPQGSHVRDERRLFLTRPLAEFDHQLHGSHLHHQQRC